MGAFFMLYFRHKGVDNMFFTVDEIQEINKRTRHIPKMYVREIREIIQDVLNHKPYKEQVVTRIITSEDYD